MRLFQIPLLLSLSLAAHGFAPPARTASPRSSLNNRGSFLPTVSPLLLADKDESSSPLDEKMSFKVRGRKKRVFYGYRFSSMGFAVVTLLTLWWQRTRTWHVVAPLIVSSLAHILQAAAQKDRLTSDTYKRMNLVLVLYGLIGCCTTTTSSAAAASSSFTKRNLLTWYRILSLITMVNSIKGYGYGCKGWELKGGMKVVRADLIQLYQSSVRTILSFPTNLASASYTMLTYLTGGCALWKVWGMLFSGVVAGIGGGSIASLGDYTQWLLLSFVSFTLKDAADRDRLGGTTFVQLDMILSIAVASLVSVYFKSWGVGTLLWATWNGIRAYQEYQQHRKAATKNAES